jgi:citrate synthase
MSNDTGHESEEESDEREGPNQQYGFNGKPRSYVNTDSAICISNQKQVHLSSSQSLDHEIIREFTEQCLANDFRTNPETLIDGTSWTVILLRAIALYADHNQNSKTFNSSNSTS